MTIKLNTRQALQSDITPLSDFTKAHVLLPFQTPWRLIMIAGSAIELTTNRLIYALNDPPSQDFSWVKTLKFIGIWLANGLGPRANAMVPLLSTPKNISTPPFV